MPNDCPISVLGLDDPSSPVRLRLVGPITVGLAKELHAFALDVADQNRDVVVCCQKAEYLDAAAIQVLMCLGRELHGRDRNYDLSGLTPRVRDDFRLVGLAHVLPEEPAAR